MGRYIGWDDVVNKYPAAASRGGASTIGSAYIGFLEAEIDGRLSSHFTTPFSSNNVTVKDICIDLAYSRIGNFKIKERLEFDKAIKDRIEGLKNGAEAMVTIDGTILSSSLGTIYSTTQDYHPVFGMSPTEYFVVDSSQVQDEEAARV